MKSTLLGCSAGVAERDAEAEDNFARLLSAGGWRKLRERLGPIALSCLRQVGGKVERARRSERLAGGREVISVEEQRSFFGMELRRNGLLRGRKVGVAGERGFVCFGTNRYRDLWKEAFR